MVSEQVGFPTGVGEHGAAGGDPGGGGKRTRFVGAAVVVLLIIGGIAGYLVSRSDSSHPIDAAAEECEMTSNVGDDGASISFSTKGEDDVSGDSYMDVVCVLVELEVPDRVISKMDSTRALDGTVSATWDRFEASWNYHPNSGMNLDVYERD